MIEVKNKHLCCGCGACEQKCPLHCIQLKEDNEGFLYPFVNKEICTDCGVCEKTCPIINRQQTEMQALASYAAKNPVEEERMQSSSGGLFIVFAKEIVKRGGVVFGARFTEDFEVIHDSIDKVDQLALLMKSKYVQSKIGDSYKRVKEYLRTGREVLFVGTPCQIAGLNKYLYKKYENLYTIDFVCHGVPSPGVWRSFIAAKQQEILKVCDGEISNISFREKRESGWRNFSFVLSYKCSIRLVNSEQSEFNYSFWGKPFIKNLFFRPSCHQCYFKSLSSGSDLTISDFWGVENVYPLLDDDKGLSSLIVNTSHGKSLLDKVSLDLYRCKLKDIINGNKALIESSKSSLYRNLFFNKFEKGEPILSILKEYSNKMSLRTKLACKLKSYPQLLFILKNIKKKAIGVIKFLDINIAIAISHLLKCKYNNRRALLIPADSLTGGFGEDVMVAGFLECCEFPVTILLDRTEHSQVIADRNDVSCKLGLNGCFPCISLINDIRKHSDLYVIGADIMDGVYDNNRLRFVALQMAHNMGVEAHITGFSIRQDSSNYFKRKIKLVSKFIQIKARDFDSYTRMSQYVERNRLLHTSDIAFLCGEPKISCDKDFEKWIENAKIQGKKIVAYCPNTIQAKSMGLKQYLEKQIILLKEFVKHGCYVVFLYHDLRRYALGINDKQLSYMLYNYIQDNGYFVEDIRNGVEIKAYIKAVDFTVTGRMHFGISGYTLDKPMFGICYFNKFEGLQKMFGVDSEVSLIDYKNIESGLGKVREFIHNFPEYISSVKKCRQAVVELALLNY